MPKRRDVDERRILTERLQDIGLDGLEATLWSEFAHTALRTIRIAEWKLNRPTNWAAFRVMRGTRVRPWEDDISDALHRHLDDMYLSARLGSPHAEIHIGYQERARVPHRVGPDVRRMDLRFRRKWLPGKAGMIAVEAKRLLKASDITDHYLSLDGMGCLTDPVDGYTTECLAFMLGYLIDRNRSTWEDRLRSALAAIATPRVTCQAGATSHDGSTIYNIVERQSTDHGPIMIVHRFLTFESN